MAGRFRIRCITKPNRESPVEHITHVGGVDGTQWTLPVESVIWRIKQTGTEHYDFYVRVGNDEAEVVVVPATQYKREHIKTVPDRTQRDNLLSLPECPQLAP